MRISLELYNSKNIFFIYIFLKLRLRSLKIIIEDKKKKTFIRMQCDPLLSDKNMKLNCVGLE